MIIFSDLDRSIIYSNKFIEEFNKFQNDCECIEKINGKEFAYISIKTLQYLKEIQSIGTFIPTTTRTTEQFKRIDFDIHSIKFKYAITSNGGVILKDDEPLKEWQIIVDNIISSSGKRISMIKEFEKYKNVPGILKIKEAGDIFFYMIVDKSVFNLKNINDYITTLEHNNWTYYISGRKIYFLPKGITKENAIKYILCKENINKFIAIGDSRMDLEMLKLSPDSYCLKHGEATKNIDKNYKISDSYGMDGTEEILSHIIEKYLSYNQ